MDKYMYILLYACTVKNLLVLTLCSVNAMSINRLFQLKTIYDFFFNKLSCLIKYFIFNFVFIKKLFKYLLVYL